jgi:hypothetical protein
MLDSVCLLGSKLNAHATPGKPEPSRNTIGVSIRPPKLENFGCIIIDPE